MSTMKPLPDLAQSQEALQEIEKSMMKEHALRRPGGRWKKMKVSPKMKR